MANKTEKFWDKLAKDVDESSDHLEESQIAMISEINQYIHSDSVLLDYGCARGGISLGLAEKVKEVHGIDISSKMIQIAKKRATFRKLENVHFTHAEICDSHYLDNSFDVILALNTFHLVENLDEAIKCLSALLKPDGILISQTPCLGEQSNPLSFFAGSLLWLTVKSGIIPKVGFHKIKGLERILANEGLEKVKSKTIRELFSTSIFSIYKKRQNL